MKKLTTLLLLVLLVSGIFAQCPTGYNAIGVNECWGGRQFLNGSSYTFNGSSIFIKNSTDSLYLRYGMIGLPGIGFSARGTNGDTTYIGSLLYDGHKLAVLMGKKGVNYGAVAVADSGVILYTTSGSGARTSKLSAVGDTLMLGVNGNNLRWPTTDGSSGQFMQTNGSGALSFATVASSAVRDSAWLLVGNTAAGLTDSATKFIGSTFQFPLIHKTNNVERYRISSNGTHTWTLPNTSETGATFNSTVTTGIGISIVANALTTGSGLSITNTVGNGSTGPLLNVLRSGTATADAELKAAYIGTTSASNNDYSIGLQVECSGSQLGTNNALYASSGRIAIGSLARANLNSGDLIIENSSGAGTALLGLSSTQGIQISYSNAGNTASSIYGGWNGGTASTSGKFTIGNTGDADITIQHDNKIGIGPTTTTPTARFHLPAGSATANTAPLKFTSGTNLTTAEPGAMEYNGTNLFFTRTGTTRESVMTVNAVNVVSPTAPDRTITVVIDGTTYYITAKTTND